MAQAWDRQIRQITIQSTSSKGIFNTPYYNYVYVLDKIIRNEKQIAATVNVKVILYGLI